MINAFYDVHVWPSEGRIVMINCIGFGSFGPAVTHLTVGVPSDSANGVRDESIVIACALAKAGTEVGTLIEHRSDGSMVELHTESLATLAVLRSARVAV